MESENKEDMSLVCDLKYEKRPLLCFSYCSDTSNSDINVTENIRVARSFPLGSKKIISDYNYCDYFFF